MMPARLKRVFHHIVHDPPGERFILSYERRRHRGEEHPVRRWAVITLGTILVGLGFIMLVTPGPGLIVGFVGLALIAARSRWLARALDRSELWVRRGLHRFRRH